MMKARLIAPMFVLIGLLSACDGGINGTGGPGGDFVDNPPTQSGGPGSDGAPEVPDLVAIEPLESDVEFANPVDASGRSDAIFKLIHGVSNLGPVVASINDGSGEFFIDLPGLQTGEGGEFYESLTADTLELDVFLADDVTGTEPAEQIVGANPLTLGVGSATSAILRGSLDPALEAPLELLPIANQLSTNDPGTIIIRVIHAAAAFGANGPVDIFVTPESAASPTQGFPSFSSVTYEEGDAGFIEISTDSILITAVDADGVTQRIPTLDALEPAPSSSTTLIIIDDPDGVPGVDVIVLIVNDGDRTGLPDL